MIYMELFGGLHASDMWDNDWELAITETKKVSSQIYSGIVLGKFKYMVPKPSRQRSRKLGGVPGLFLFIFPTG
jgi:hypothetical protein